MSTVGRSKLGTLWIPASGRFLGCSSPRRESISGGEEFRGSDEAVVSNDPTGQHNPMASQGPLDGRVVGCWESCHIEPRGSRTGNPYGITYSWEMQLRWRISRGRGAYLDGT